MCRKKIFLSLLVFILALAGAGSARADQVTIWNETLLQAIRTDKTPPPKASRAMAIMNVSIYDAVAGLLGGSAPYHVTDAAPAGASPDAAAAGAAHRTLVALFPAQAATLDGAYTAALLAIPDGAAKTGGIAWGEQVADQILALRAHDHATDTVTYSPPTGGTWWIPTPPAFAPALLPNWPRVTPWTMTSGAQFRQGPPPTPGSAAYRSALREIHRLGSAGSTQRTADQTQIALFWADGGGTATPPGHWLIIAEGLAQQHSLTLVQSSRLFALLSLAVADAAIVAWDHKYYYSDWRPVTGIQHADLAGDPTILPEPHWTPLIPTPPFPSYTSGHSTFSGASAKILELFFGTDAIAFSTTSDGLPGVQRSFSSLSAAAEEAGQSRIYGGIHWQYDNQAGLASGRALAEHVFFNELAPTVAAGPCKPGPTVLCLNGGRFKATAQWRTASATGAGQSASLGDGLGDDAGQFWFFAADNPELVVKVLDSCAGFGHFWVFASGLTNVEVTLTVTDTQNGTTRRYFNPLGKPFAPLQDVNAFATCP